MKKLLWTSAMALTAAACMTACDDSNGASNSIPEFKTEAALPDTCEMEVAKAGDTYFACFENKWIEVTDSATVEQFKDGLDEDEVKAKLEELEDLLKPATPAKPKSSSSKKTDEDVESSDSEEPESSSSEECTGRRCKTGSSSSKKSSGGSGSGSGEGGSGEGGEGGDSSPSSTDSSSPSSTDSSDDSSPSSATSGTSTESKCGTETYDPETQFCYNETTVYDKCGDGKGGLIEYDPEDSKCIENKVVLFMCCSKAAACSGANLLTHPSIFYNTQTQFCSGSGPRIYDKCGGEKYTPSTQFCDTRGTGTIYKMVTIGTQTWMAENLNYETTSGSYCYNDEPENCETYGRVYNWSATTEACPTGWNLPSLDDWSDLIDKSGYDYNTTSYRKSGTNETGFSSIDNAPYRLPSGSYGTYTRYWSSTAEGTDSHYYLYLGTGTSDMGTSYSSGTSEYAYPVRCIKD